RTTSGILVRRKLPDGLWSQGLLHKRSLPCCASRWSCESTTDVRRPVLPGLFSPGFPWLRDLLKHLAREWLVPGMHGQIAQRYYPDQPLAAVQDGEAPNLVLLHQAGRLLQQQDILLHVLSASFIPPVICRARHGDHGTPGACERKACPGIYPSQAERGVLI